MHNRSHSCDRKWCSRCPTLNTSFSRRRVERFERVTSKSNISEEERAWLGKGGEKGERMRSASSYNSVIKV